MTNIVRKSVITSVLFASFVLSANVTSAATLTATELSFDREASWFQSKAAEAKGEVHGLLDNLSAASNLGSIATGAWDHINRFAKPTAGALDHVAEELRCMAMNIYHEARGEPFAGQVAVGHVVMNRVASKRYPNTICEVVKQGGAVRLHRCQFSWYCDRLSDEATDRDAYRASMHLALQIYLGYSEDPTGGAMWYHADYVSPRWRNMFQRGPKIGQHIFYQLASN